LDIIEINPQYIDMSRTYPEIAAYLDDPRVSMHINDGRRWLNTNPDKKFDFELMNTTFHYRSHATNLLSKDFLLLLKKSLNPGGVILYNSAPLTMSSIQQLTHLSL